MTFRPDTSFPFLAVARKYGVAYGEVLAFAEKCERNLLTVAPFQLSTWRLETIKALCGEALRRRAIEL